MISWVIITIEIISIILCVYNIFGVRTKLKLSFISLTLALAATQEIMNLLGINAMGTILVYIILFFYCKTKFKKSAILTVIKLVVQLVFLVGIQFICLVLFDFFFPGDENSSLRVLAANILVLVCMIMMQRKMELNKMCESVLRKSLIALMTGAVICTVILLLLASYKIEAGIFREAYLIPMLLSGFTLLWMMKWAVLKVRFKELKEKEIIMQRAGEEQDNFQELLMNVRLRQHEVKNHLEAIFSTHYTYKTYDKLVQAQNEYWRKMKEENKYNCLLQISDRQLAGYLYGKLQSIEEYGIIVECTVKSTLNRLSVSGYTMVEILGIFIDNAAEASMKLEERKFSITIQDREEAYLFSIRNRYPYVPYEEMADWFKWGVSDKGDGRGLGLYHARRLCEKWKCRIFCENKKIEDENWIQFVIEVKKANSR